MFIFIKFPSFYCHLDCHHLQLSLKRILSACQAPVVGHGTCWHHPPRAPHCGGAWIDRTWTCLQIVLKNALNWGKWKSQHITILMDSVFCFWQGSYISPQFHLSCLLQDVLRIWSLQQRSHCFWTCKTTQELAFYPFSALQTSFQHFKVSLAFFSSLNKDLM